MNCIEIERQLEAYYDGQCQPALHQVIETHLGTCSHCKTALAEWSALSQLLFSRPPVKASPYLWTRVLAGIESEEKELVGAWWGEWRWMGRITAITAVAVLLISGFTFFDSTNGGATLEILIQGQNNNASPMMQLSRNRSTQTEVVAWLLGDQSWRDD